MKYQRTQVYLDPDDHRALVREAAARGISLAELMRRLVAGHVAEQAAPYEPRTMAAIIAVADDPDAPASDVARKEERYKDDAFTAMQPSARRRERPAR